MNSTPTVPANPAATPNGVPVTVFIEALKESRRLNTSQLAYLVVPFIGPAFEESNRRRLAGIRNSKTKTTDAETVESWSATLGISARTLCRARQLHELFLDDTPRTLTDRDGVTEENVTFKSFFEPRLLKDYGNQRHYGLGDIIQAILRVQISARFRQDRVKAFLGAGFCAQAKHWDTFTPDEKAMIQVGLRESFQTFPPELRRMIHNASRYAERNPQIRGS